MYVFKLQRSFNNSLRPGNFNSTLENWGGGLAGLTPAITRKVVYRRKEGTSYRSCCRPTVFVCGESGRKELIYAHTHTDNMFRVETLFILSFFLRSLLHGQAIKKKPYSPPFFRKEAAQKERQNKKEDSIANGIGHG